MKEYKFSIDDYDFFLKIEVYETREKMYKGLASYLKEDRVDKEAIAFFASYHRSITPEKLNKRKLIFERELGKLFFCSKYLEYDIIAHECFHASFEYVRSFMGYTGSYTTNSAYSDSNEEFINCIFTDIYREALYTLKNNRYKIRG